MTPEKYREVIEAYERFFKEIGLKKIKYHHDRLIFSKIEGLSHCYGMLDKMLVFLEEERFDKLNRWLGFVQGCLWLSSKNSLEELRNHNRPK